MENIQTLCLEISEREVELTIIAHRYRALWVQYAMTVMLNSQQKT